MKTSKLTLLTAIFLAMSLTMSCSSDSDEEDPSSSSTGGVSSSTDGTSSGGAGTSSDSGNVSSSSDGSGVSSSSLDLGGNGTSKEEAISLTNGQWMEGELTEAAPEVWYKFNAVAGTTYYVWWNTNGASEIDAMVSAFDNAEQELFDTDDVSVNEPETVRLNSNGTIYLKVTPYYEGDAGTFSIVFSNTNSMPREMINGSCIYAEGYMCIEFAKGFVRNAAEAREECEDGYYGDWDSSYNCAESGYIESSAEGGYNIHYVWFEQPPTTSTSLTAEVDRTGTITSANAATGLWYKFNAEADQIYIAKFGDLTLDVVLEAYDKNGKYLCHTYGYIEDSYDECYIYQEESGSVYLRVTPYYEGDTGTFELGYAPYTYWFAPASLKATPVKAAKAAKKAK